MRCCPQVPPPPPTPPPSLILYGLFAGSFWTSKIETFCYFLNLHVSVQVHGIANDTIKFVQNIINTEINSATDNPVSSPPNLKLHVAL